MEESEVQIALFNNNHSYELIHDYISEENIVLVNISMMPIQNTDFCLKKSDNLFEYFKKILSFNKFVNEQIKTNDSLTFYLPNINHIYCGMILGKRKKYKKNITIIQIAEGTLNYSSRFIDSFEYGKRLLKKILSVFFKLNYRLSNLENLDFSNVSKQIICRRRNGLNANKSMDVEEVPFKNKFNDLRNSTKNSVLLIGTHIHDKYSSFNKEKVKNAFIKIPIDWTKVINLYYLPHPRSKDNGKQELSVFYSFCKNQIVVKNENINELFNEIYPEDVIALCGSTFFLEINGFDSVRKIAWGFDLMDEMGSSESTRLRKVHENLGTLIC